MILLDTNTIIYLYQGKLDKAQVNTLGNSTLHTCNIIVAEVLGYPLIDHEDERFLRDFFDSMKNQPFDKPVTEKAIELRKTIRIKLPDAIIAATALTHDLELWTHNTADFKDVPGLQLFDPLLG